MHVDGVQAIIPSPEPVTIICIGPVPNIAEALRREPRIAKRTRFVGMHGSFHWHLRSNPELSMEPGASAEWHVCCDIASAQTVFSAPWLSTTITPPETCACVVLDGARYQQLRKASDPLMHAVIDDEGFTREDPEARFFDVALA